MLALQVTGSRSRTTQGGAAPVAHATHRCRSARLRRCVLAAATGAGVVAFLLAIDPRSLAGALAHVHPGLIVAALVLAGGFYALQGLRWHQLLRAVGARQRLRDSELMNLAGQVATAVVPVGDLTRAWLASRSAGIAMGSAAATVTVQELGFTLLLVLTALPGLIALPGGIAVLAATVLGVGAILVILTVEPAFRAVRGAVARIPGAERLLTAIDGIDAEVRRLLRRPDVGLGAGLDLGRVVVAATSLWLILLGLHVNVSWWQASLVMAVAYVGGALSLLPGGLGANEAGVVGVLVVLGVDPAHAAAAAVLQRLWLGAPALVGGAGAALLLRRRRDPAMLHAGTLLPRSSGGRPGPPAAVAWMSMTTAPMAAVAAPADQRADNPPAALLRPSLTGTPFDLRHLVGMADDVPARGESIRPLHPWLAAAPRSIQRSHHVRHGGFR
jgi:uncharacterized protein (TIRG00374 family)